MGSLLEVDAWEKTSLCKTESRTGCKQSAKVCDKTHECAADAPCHHGRWQPYGRAHELHHDVGGDLSRHVERVKDCQSNLVFLVSSALHTETE